MNRHNSLLIDCKTEWMVKILLFCVLLQALIFSINYFSSYIYIIHIQLNKTGTQSS